uniref:Uncharacterized protein n=1 Tax=Chrysemys picta bellii TaxID=8478 RepID=A0A8C3J178_CHRPI|nr:aldo-keto reductase family 1 member C3-like isoform X4 [Chrysemys picta bellii]
MELDKDLCIKMNDGNKIPALGFGTYCPDDVQKSKCEEATKVAIEVGFRHIDGAFVYGIEEEVGRAVHEKIADGTVKREDIFYTGKLWNTFHRPELVRSCLEQSLKKLKFDYLDLFIIHNPMSLKAFISVQGRIIGLEWTLRGHLVQSPALVARPSII